MANEQSLPWIGTSVGDAGPYSDATWRQLWQNIIGWGGGRANSGVFLMSGTEPNDGLKVQAQNPNTTAIDVLIGAALVQGLAYINTATQSFTIAPNSSGNPRIDLVVVRVDYALQTGRLTVIQGTPAASPSAPSMTQIANTMWDIPIAEIAVANGFSSISNSNITNRKEWVNAPPAVYLDGIVNNSGSTLINGRVVVWDNTADRAATTTTTQDAKGIAGIWRSNTANGGYGRVQVRGIGYVYCNAAVTRGQLLVTSTTAGQAAPATAANNAIIGRALETTSGAGMVLANIHIRSVRDEDYILVRDEKTSGTAPASIVLGAWRTRELNTLAIDTAGIASVGSNRVTIPAGTYVAFGGAPTDAGRIGRARLQNVTDGATLLEGSSSFGGQMPVAGEFVITGTKAIEIQQYMTTTGNGGNAVSTGETEKYAWIYLVRKAETP